MDMVTRTDANESASSLGAEVSGRATCYACFRPIAVCYCDVVEPISHETRIIIVQHPREEFHPLNTARIAERCLTRAEVLRGDVPDLDAAFARLELPQRTALLYPSSDAVDVTELEEAERPECVVVIDGTWNQARAMNRRLSALARLPRVRFTPDAPSEYRIRKEPKADYLSTVESIALVLSHLEPRGFDAERLRATFRAMIDRNVDARRKSAVIPRHKALRPSRAPALPPELLTPPERMWVAYGEGAPDPEGKREKRPFIVCVGSGASEDERLRAVLKTPFRPHPIASEAHALTEEELASALGPEEFAERFAEVCRPGDVIAAWNESSLTVIEDALGRPLSTCGISALPLKNIYCNLRSRGARQGASEKQAAWGSLGDIVRRENISVEAVGRAARRLAETRAVLALLRQLSEI